MPRLISVTYGHHGSGKLYDYETDKNYRAGDVVVVPVQHAKSGKQYNTLAVVQRTLDSEGSAGQNVKNYLEGNRDKKGRFKVKVTIKDVSQRLEVAKSLGLDVKNDRAVNITTLPGYSTRLSDDSWSRPESSSRLISRGDD